MSDKAWILRKAKEEGLWPSTIEKDYVLGWLLAGIASDRELADTWIFKGGTCLKKCYFEKYRFSEDLDFTLLDPTHIDASWLAARLAKITRWIASRTQIEFPLDHIHFKLYQNPYGKMCAQGKIHYKGPLKPKVNLPKVKFDLTCDEVVVFPATPRPIFHDYGDSLGTTIQTYDFDELFAEKFRALVQRARPRDLYDIAHIFKQREISLNRKRASSAFAKKCAFRDIKVDEHEHLLPNSKRSLLDEEWSMSLSHQVATPVDISECWSQFEQALQWIIA